MEMDVMGKLIRLDKYLTDLRIGSRKEVKTYIKKGKVQVDGEIIKDSKVKINPDNAKVYFENKQLNYQEKIYLMLNKPAGVVSATKDLKDQTVIDLLDKKYHRQMFPVGRLDKDTEGLLLITNHGELAHKLLSPKNKVAKVYYAKIEGQVSQKERKKFEDGIELGDFTCLPAKLDILHSASISEVHITIYEGKFHQVKRMFEAVDMKVIYLKRLSMGSLTLDENLPIGSYRPLTKEEIYDLTQGD